jgi:hypothetical protein
MREISAEAVEKLYHFDLQKRKYLLLIPLSFQSKKKILFFYDRLQGFGIPSVHSVLREIKNLTKIQVNFIN